MGTINPNQTLLQGKNQSTPDLTPAALAGPPNKAGFNFTEVQPPSPIYVQRDDKLIVQTMSSIASEVITLRVRYLRLDGQIIPEEFVMNLGGAFAGNTFLFQLAEGFILAMAATASLAGLRGQTYARVALQRGTTSGQTAFQTLISEYMTNLYPATWPGGLIRHATEGPGELISLTVSNPAAGADWIFTVGGNSRDRIISLQAQFVASATVANRAIQLVLDDSLTPYWTSDATVNVTAGQTVQLVAAGVQATTGIVTTVLPVTMPPALNMPVNHRIRTSTTGIQVGDQWSLIRIMVERSLEL